MHRHEKVSVFGELNWELAADEGGSLPANHHPSNTGSTQGGLGWGPGTDTHGTD